ncbi:hypothetical protein LEP1GSC178_1302 [Leptospira licerasiae str. MMD4847]|uniref:Uncharacterized protein n=1 Tax=Leptospira licerasiae str. MMD4847 TaxID=1049971 RepID=A0ABN0H567_9LEPT|nr:hypothetical protein LEP1GSC178_1302 [Leptospira licerasiae str. MMD4847]
MHEPEVARPNEVRNRPKNKKSPPKRAFKSKKVEETFKRRTSL